MELKNFLDFHRQKRLDAVLLYPSVPPSLITLEVALVLWWGEPPPHERILKICLRAKSLEGILPLRKALDRFHPSPDST